MTVNFFAGLADRSSVRSIRTIGTLKKELHIRTCTKRTQPTKPAHISPVIYRNNDKSDGMFNG
jgi:hypothetical protein